ncbi:MAG: hypothetical protein K0S55_1958 [Clostridia bacterium]|nr:hypothetical protein [Clostridia bacterium]
MLDLASLGHYVIILYYNAFDEYHVKHNLSAMEKLFARYVNERITILNLSQASVYVILIINKKSIIF